MSRLAGNWEVTWDATGKAVTMTESFFRIFLLLCIGRKVLFPNLMLMVKLPFDTSWEKEGKRDLLSSSAITLQSNLTGLNCT